MNQQKPRDLQPKHLQNWLKEESVQPILVDVREKEELSIASFPYPVLHLPLSESLSWVENFPFKLSFERPVVVLCHSGIRSMSFGIWLLEQDSRYDVWNLEGGIDAWSEFIDPSVPRY